MSIPFVPLGPVPESGGGDLTAVIDLLEADQIIELSGGVQVLRTYKRGTNTELLPAKAAKQPGGAALTNPVTQQLAGYRE